MPRAMSSVWSSRWSFVDGVPIHERATLTSGPPVVLVHGLLVSSRYMTRLAAELRGHFSVFGVDMPGFGLSGDPGDIPDVDGLARWLGRWLEERDLHDVTMVANSFGCQYAAALAATDPSRMGRLVLAGPTMDPEHRTAVRQATMWASNGPLEPPSLLGVIARDLVDFGLARLAVTYRHALGDAIEDRLPKIAIPTVVVRGERDPLVLQRWAEEATALLPHARLEVIPGAGHTITYNSPAAVAGIVRDENGAERR